MQMIKVKKGHVIISWLLTAGEDDVSLKVKRQEQWV
jgi:hypothetical protein